MSWGMDHHSRIITGISDIRRRTVQLQSILPVTTEKLIINYMRVSIDSIYGVSRGIICSASVSSFSPVFEIKVIMK